MSLYAQLLVSFPRTAQVGKRYPLTIDLEHDANAWTLPGEELALHCVVEGGPAFTCEAEGDASLVVHRFGGTYGPARFVLRARQPAEVVRLKVTLLDARGRVIRASSLEPIRVDEAPLVWQPTAFGRDDAALVIGISRYARLPSFPRASVGARAILDWIISPEGGGVPPDRASLVLDDAATAIGILEAVDRLNDGRRRRTLYVYASGHGSDGQATTLIGFDTERVALKNTILGVLDRGWFAQAVLLTECSRVDGGEQLLRAAGTLRSLGPAGATRASGKLLVCAATVSDQAAFSAQGRSPFTSAVLHALALGRERGMTSTQLMAAVMDELSRVQAPLPYAEVAGPFELFPSPPVQATKSSSFAPPTLDVVAASPAMRGVLALAATLDRRRALVISGERGTGKETLARALHARSLRSGPFVGFDCAALTSDAAEHELLKTLEEAKGGTLMLKRAEHLSASGQRALLQAALANDVRVIATTELATRERLTVTLETLLREAPRIDIPPLRERREDIPELALHFARQIAPSEWTLTQDALAALVERSWPGNANELYDVIAAALRRTKGPEITLDDLSLPEVVARSGVGQLGPLTWYLWPNGARLKVRFLDGPAALHKQVLDIAKEWSKHANVTFEHIQKGPAAIRISFRELGSWAYRGTTALQVPPDQATVNLGVTLKTPHVELRRTVLHELGEVLGLVNETQSPNCGIRWNRDAVTRDMMRPPNSWTRDQVDRELLATYADSQVMVGDRILTYRPFDPSSVMMPAIPAEWMQVGFPPPVLSELSRSDAEFIRALYPADLHEELDLGRDTLFQSRLRARDSHAVTILPRSRVISDITVGSDNYSELSVELRQKDSVITRVVGRGHALRIPGPGLDGPMVVRLHANPPVPNTYTISVEASRAKSSSARRAEEAPRKRLKKRAVRR